MTARGYWITSPKTRLDIEYQGGGDHGQPMKHRIRIFALGLALSALAFPASAACFADYKAKKDNPLKLHYGVIKLPNSACTSPSAAAKAIAPRLAAAGWTLLNIVSLFDESGLNGRQANAGPYFLRF